VFKTITPRNIRLAEALIIRERLALFMDESSRGSKAYIEFGAEMIERIKSI
jgi:chromosome partitioning protein